MMAVKVTSTQLTKTEKRVWCLPPTFVVSRSIKFTGLHTKWRIVNNNYCCAVRRAYWEEHAPVANYLPERVAKCIP